MPDIRGTTLTPSTSKIDYLEALQEAVGSRGLKTLAPDSVDSPELQNLRRSLANSTATAPGRYTCSSEKPLPVTIRGINNRATLQGGFRGVIPRWKPDNPPQPINFAAFANGYPRPGLALLAANALRDAANDWNKLDLGVKFEWVEDISKASFVLSYAGNQEGVLAEAFFPNEDDLSYLNVYSAAFQPGKIQYLKNIFLHELGHVLGLRHEFAPELEDTKDDFSVQFGPRNPLSVMGYEFPPQLQTSDIDSAQAFYRFPGSELGWKEAHVPRPKRKMLPIKDCTAR
ncbi:zincin [Aspergillus piperis CBS 112811]|uniref:Zincin n=1 Tax=Aspergillus piperis CBS 112811 TaxID=1448313 RepID=A0A8G1QXE2_9EURO|nr:zincin [Aspergillus piperis CBS 112811]RAH53125.1 zincin [Aspergillus piperis CBS 112811]